MSKVRLGDVAIEVRETSKNPEGLPVVGLEHLISGEITLTQWSEASDNTFTKLFHKGQILFGRRRAYLKKAAVAPFDGVCSGDITVIAANPDKLLPDLLPFIISNDAFFDYAMEKSAGSLSPRVKWAQLAEYEFDLPELEKQQKLANLLWAMERTRKSYQDLLTQTDELVKSQFVEMFGDDSYPHRPLIDLIIPGAGLSYGIVQPGDEGTGDMGVLRPVDLVDGGIKTDDIKYVDRAIGESYKRTELQGDEILITVRGTTGVTALTDPRFIGMNVTRGIAVIRYNPDMIMPEFLNAYLRSKSGQEYIQSHTQGTTLRQINMSDLRKMPIMIPPEKAQLRYISFVDMTDKSKLAIRQALESLEKSRSAIMTKVFG